MQHPDIFFFDQPLPATGIPLMDSHCHIQFPDFDQDREQVIQNAKDAGLTAIVCIGTNLEDSIQAIELAKSHPGFIYATVGNHPYQSDQSTSEFTALIEQNPNQVVAIGETGLDYFRSPIPKEIQQKSFAEHCRLASKFNLPIVIHLREFADCYQDAKKILLEHKVKKAIFHCYTGDLASAQEIWSHQWRTSFALITFYPSNQNLLQIHDLCPPEFKLIETDSPYLPPYDKRGTRNEPGRVSELTRKYD